MTTAIIGRSCSGKTTLAKRLHDENPSASVYFTDDYIHHGFVEAVHALLADLKADSNPDKFIEGMQVPRLLRKGLENKDFRVDKIIICKADDEIRNQRYAARETGKDIKKRDSFDAMTEKIFEEYLNAEPDEPVIEYYYS